MDRPTRRQVLAGSTALSVPPVAGCFGDAGDGNEAVDGADPGTDRDDADDWEDADDDSGQDAGGDEGDDETDPDDGDPVRWTYEAGTALSTVAGGRVYGIERLDDGLWIRMALDAETGERRWQFGETGGFTGYRVTVGDGVYLGRNTDGIGDGDGELYALDDDGAERWSRDVGSVYDRPVLEDGVLWFGTDRGIVYALDADSGETRWTKEMGESGTVPTVEAVDEETCYVTVDGRLLGLDPSDGEERWRYDAGDRIQSVRVDDGVVYTTGARSDASGRARNAGGSRPTGRSGSRGRSTVTRS